MARAIGGLPPQAADRRSMGSLWGWFVVLGVALLVLSGVALFNLTAATITSVFLVGVVMLIGAIGQIVHAFQVRRWGGFALLLLSGLLYGVAGVLAFANPSLAAVALTLLLAGMLIASGVTRIWWSFVLRSLRGWGWITASGVITVLAGAVFLVGWPENAVWLLGMVLAVDLALQGAGMIGFGLALKQSTK